MVYCEHAHKLLREAKRTVDVLPPYNDETVRAGVRETRTLLEFVTRAADEHRASSSSSSSSSSNPPPSADPPPLSRPDMAGLLVHHVSVRRNKRALLAYHRRRLDRVQEMAWASGMTGVAAAAAAPAGDAAAAAAAAAARSCLSANEESFLRAYSELGRKYARAAARDAFTDLVDLLVPTAALLPPRELYITVRVLRDCGEIFTESGTVVMRKGEEHFIRRSDVERLIAQGSLQHVA
ncbi:MAG: DNA replication complex GINS protein PSF1 [Olpidium bornovanus]|uniref:DNA replication complex GINS protein PSF1 n=1 Tax=Olpidium bornovanus TaxID=278681 RepID=A0A8H8DGS4_9FUNG|nr:MAG: DNA replication complex GINS protein PSF1 [Olpidium bornovanus]